MISSRIIIGRNIRAIRKQIGLSVLNFSILTQLSKATIVNIESGKNGYNLNLLDNVLSFTGYELKDISNTEFQLDPDLREKLISRYAKHPQFTAILEKKPEVNYAISQRVLNGEFLESPKEIREIKSHLDSLGFDYDGTAISVALKRMPSLIRIEPHPSKKGTFLYSKK